MSSNDSPQAPDAAREMDILAAWAPELAETFASLACDVALVLSTGGMVLKRAATPSYDKDTAHWQGIAWIDTATPDSRRKVQALLDEVTQQGRSGRHEINHHGIGTIPLAWRAARLGRDGPILAVAHDLRAQAEMQQRFLAAQEALERSYWNAQRQQFQEGDGPPLMTADERHKLGLERAAHLDDPGGDGADALKLALDRLHERIGRDSLQGLLRDARRLAEQQFLRRALQRAGSLDALARSLGVSRRALLRRGGQALRRPPP
ncbi:MAG: hypothetical protein JNJ71_16015 [Rubrivivax sp.]|nr:hypothetical protein [Rubrivivax sp.]